MQQSDFDFPTAPGYVGLFVSLDLLKDEQVRAFIATVREREGIYAPIDREELLANLAAHDPEQFVDEAMPVADDYLFRGLVPEEFANVDADALAERLQAQLPAQLMQALAGATGLLEDFFQVDTSVPTAARVIARHIVTGCLEVPEPVPMSMAAVGKLNLGDGASVLVAFIMPYADIDAVAEEIRDAFRRHYVTGERNRVPTRITQTLWLRHCAFELDLEDEEESSYRKLAELAFEIWPELAPEAKGNTPEWKAAVEREMERFRKNKKAWEERRDRGLWGPEG